MDWLRPVSSTVYQIQNLTKVDTQGMEANLTIYPDDQVWQEVSLGYAFNDRNKKQSNLVSKYVFDYLKHKFVLGVKNNLWFDVAASSQLIYQQRANAGGDFVLDTGFSKQFEQYSVFCKINNIFNHGYAEKANIPMPGREIFAGAQVQF